MKKSLYLVTALAGVMSAHAEAPRTGLDGFSIGLQGGYGIGESKATRRTTFPANGPLQNVSDNSSISQRGALGGANIEYGRIFNNTYFAGLQVNAMFGRGKGSINTHVNAPAAPFSTSVKLKNSYGVAIRLGKTVAGTVLPYAKIGIVTSKWDSRTVAVVQNEVGSASKRRTGWELGAGVDFSVNPCVAVGAEVSHLQYQKFSYDVKNPFNEVVYNARVKPRENRVLLRVKYKLGA